jgi:hypothetical protein
MDPDENDVLGYAWLIDGVAVPGATTGLINVTLAEGFHNISLVLTDDVGTHGTANVMVYVEAVAPPRLREDGWPLLPIAVMLLIVILALLGVYILRRRSGAT